MEIENRLSDIPLADINSSELQQIMQLEAKLEDKYYLIALKKQQGDNSR